MSITNLMVPGASALAGFCLAYGLAAWLWNLRDPSRLGVLELAEERIGRPGMLTRGWSRLAPVGERLLPFMGAERSRIERKLYIAGWRKESSAALFVTAKIVLLCVAAILISVLWQSTWGLGQAQKIALSAIVLGVALLAPNWWVEHRVRRRQSRLRNGFPDALDMLVICVESGLGLTAAMERVANEIRQLHPELSLELAAVNAEIRSGVDRAAALQSLNARTGLPEIRGFVGLLAQTLQLGTGVADSLRIYSTEFRDQRMHRAEERAAKTGTKMIFPLVFCEFPAFFLVAVGPAAVRLFDAFSV